MQIDIIAPGRVKERYLRDAIDEYSKRLSRYCKLNIIEVADEKTPDHASEGVDRQIKAREGERIAKHLKERVSKGPASAEVADESIDSP